MNKRRLPIDIQFLLESILDESPDSIRLEPVNQGGTKESDPERLNSLGAEVPKGGGKFAWHADDAYAFFFDETNGVVMYTTQKTHTNMQYTLADATTDAIIHPPILFKNVYNVSTDKFGNISFYSYKDKSTVIGLIGLNKTDNEFNTLREYLRENKNFFRNLDIRGYETTATVPAGRIWIKNNVISFWNDMNTILKTFGLVEKLMSGLKLNKTKFAYEFLDHRGFFAFSELHKDSTKEKLTPEEMHAIIAQKHLKKDKNDFGTEFWDKHSEKAAKGFNFPAQASAAMPARESKIKLKDLINKNIK